MMFATLIIAASLGQCQPVIYQSPPAYQYPPLIYQQPPASYSRQIHYDFRGVHGVLRQDYETTITLPDRRQIRVPVIAGCLPVIQDFPYADGSIRRVLDYSDRIKHSGSSNVVYVPESEARLQNASHQTSQKPQPMVTESREPGPQPAPNPPALESPRRDPPREPLTEPTPRIDQKPDLLRRPSDVGPPTRVIKPDYEKRD